MTALTRYARLECTGLWRPGPGIPRREVVVILGDATLVMTDTAGRAVAHWSLAAVLRRGQAESGAALFALDSGEGEDLEISDPDMVAALGQVRGAIDRAGPRPVRRGFTLALGAAAMLAMALWLPGALKTQARAGMTAATRAETGAAILGRLQTDWGQTCRAAAGTEALARLSDRLFGPGGPRLVVMPGGLADAVELPGDIVLIPAALIAAAGDPAVPAGAAVAAVARGDSLAPLIDGLSLADLLRTLTQGALPADPLADYAARLAAGPLPWPDADLLTAAFRAAQLSPQPWAAAVDPAGTTLGPLAAAADMLGPSGLSVMADGDWVALRAICAGG